MCEPFSCIVKSDLTIIVGKSIAHHSHSGMLQDAGLPCESSINQYAKVEITPKNNEWLGDVAEWDLNLDEGREPDWWQENLPEIDARVRDAAQKWQNKIRNLTEWHVQDGEVLILASPIHAKIKMTGGYARSYGNSQQTITEMTGGAVWSFGNSKQTIMKMAGGEARSCDNSQQTITEDKR